VHQCNPYPEHSDLSSEIVRELNERDTHSEQEVREVTKGCMESGTLGDTIVVDFFFLCVEEGSCV